MDTYRANLYQLAVYAEIIERGSLTRAAESFGVSQPVVSRILQALRREYGAELTRRDGQAVTATPSGEVLYNFAKEALRAHHHARQAIRDIAGSVIGRLRLGVGSSAYERIAPHVAKFLTQHPQAEIDVQVESSTLIAEGVRAGELDAGVVIGDPDIERGLTVTEIMKERMVAVAAPHHPVAASIVPVDAWNSVTIVATSNANHVNYIKDNLIPWLPTGHNYPVIQCGSPQFVRQLVAEGAGITALPLAAVEHELADGRLLQLCFSAAISAVALAFIENPQVAATPLVREFRHLLDLPLPND